MQKAHTAQMTEEPFFRKIVLFAIPVTLTGLLQIVYNTADTAVVGQFAGKTALAAVGSTGSMIALIVNLFTGLSMGAGVLTARMLGANDRIRTQRAVHTAMGLSLVCGCLISVIGVLFSPVLLRWMQAPADTIGLSTLYVRIYFLGAPGSFSLYLRMRTPVQIIPSGISTTSRTATVPHRQIRNFFCVLRGLS